MQLTGLVPLIQVYDMATSLRFYREGLGFEVVNSSPEVDAPEGRYFHWCWLKLGGAELMLNTAYDAGERPAQPDRVRLSAHGDTGLFIGCEDVDAVYAELHAKGLAREPPGVTPYGMKQFYVSDPDGYAICFQASV